MSTTTAPPSSSSSSSSSSAQSNSDTATLYLFTFLATILILVLLSASLVLRSYILRRRFRQRFQQALTDTLLADLDRVTLTARYDPRATRRAARRFGPKPVLWDTWIRPVDHDTWSAFTPVAVRCSPSPPPSTGVSSPLPSPSSQGSSLLSQLRLSSPFSRPSSPRPPPPPAHTENDARIAVCVLVAMPTPVYRVVPDPKGKGVDPRESPAPQPSGDVDPLLPSMPLAHRTVGPRILACTSEEDGLPVLEFGVLDAKMGDWAW